MMELSSPETVNINGWYPWLYMSLDIGKWLNDNNNCLIFFWSGCKKDGPRLDSLYIFLIMLTIILLSLHKRWPHLLLPLIHEKIGVANLLLLLYLVTWSKTTSRTTMNTTVNNDKNNQAGKVLLISFEGVYWIRHGVLWALAKEIGSTNFAKSYFLLVSPSQYPSL